jgi:hypothetical protein
LPDGASSLVEFGDFRPSLCAAICRRLLGFGAAKGQEKGNVLEERLHPKWRRLGMEGYLLDQAKSVGIENLS